MQHISYNPQGVCSRKIDIDVDDNGVITNIQFTGGCSGNTQGVSALAVGMTVDQVIEKLSGIKCGFKSTSCPDQLTKALGNYKKEQ